MRIEIIGNIASGKTTLANVLSDKFHSIFENFQENPFWESFYQAPDVYSFETEITFTLQHYYQIKKELAKQTSFVCDFSLTFDRSYVDVTLHDKRLDIYKMLLEELVSEIGPPDVLIYLECPEKELLKRIRRRGRNTEKSISIDYLQSLSSSIHDNVARVGKSARVIRIDSTAIDFAHLEKGRASVKQMIMSEI
jgi:deoxyadenosine/deoxycytidine kinase